MKIDIQNNHQNAVLWDLDGTIVDSAPYHKLAWRDTFYRWGIKFTEDIHRFTLGRKQRNHPKVYWIKNVPNRN